jgi:PST family polysaccharide transporter
LIALGRSRSTFLVQLLWLVTVAPALYFVTIWTDTIRGPAVAHVAVAYCLILPVYLVVLRANGIPLGQLGRRVLPPLAAAVPMAAIMVVGRVLFDQPLLELLVGGLGVLLYAVIMTPFAQVRAWRARRGELRSEPASPSTSAISDTA